MADDEERRQLQTPQGQRRGGGNGLVMFINDQTGHMSIQRSGISLETTIDQLLSQHETEAADQGEDMTPPARPSGGRGNVSTTTDHSRNNNIEEALYIEETEGEANNGRNGGGHGDNSTLRQTISCCCRMDDEGESNSNNRKGFHRYLLCFLTIGLLVVAAISVTVILVVVLDKGKQQQETALDNGLSPEETAPTWSVQDRLDEIKQVLLESSSVDPSKLFESGTPQSRALNWLVYEDTALQSADDSTAIIQRYALMVFAFATSVELWRTNQPWNELTSIHECLGEQFPGIDCDLEPTKNLTVVTSIDLDRLKLSGTIPNEIGLLSHLTQLRLPGNKLVGSIPETLYTELTKLELIDLQINDGISSTISSQISNLQELKYFLVALTTLSGTIPKSIRSMSNLEGIHISGTRLHGPFFEHILQLTNLVSFDVSYSDVTGTIPTEIGYLTNLETIVILGSLIDIVGMPTEIWSLTNLRTLKMPQKTFGVSIKASIPSDIGKLSELDEISLTGIEGSIPTELGLLNGLSALSLEHGNLTGEIPSELGNLTNLYYLALSHNKLSGEIPSEIGNLASNNLIEFRCHVNFLEGQLPHQFCDMAGLLRYDCSVECDCCLSTCFNTHN